MLRRLIVTTIFGLGLVPGCASGDAAQPISPPTPAVDAQEPIADSAPAKTPPDTAAPEIADAATVSDAAVASDPQTVAACAACEGASTHLACTPESLTATIDGNGDPLGWGFETLPSVAARAAGLALLRCLVAHDCATDATNTMAGDNPALGCFGGVGVAPTDVLAGTFRGPCVAEFEAAAIADGLTTPSDGDGQVALQVSTAAFNPKLAIGLADHIRQCAIDAPCPVCAGL